MDYDTLPSIRIKALKDRSMLPANPFEQQEFLHGQFGPVYKMQMVCPQGEVVESVWVVDSNLAHAVLNAPSTEWRKGPQTYEPFHSLVPMHLIGLEGNEHKIMRQAAQKALNNQLHGRLIEITHQKAVKLASILKKCASDSSFSSWMVEKSGIGDAKETAPYCIVDQVDRRIRSCSLDIISTALFSKEWGAMDDYSEKNVKAYALAQMMYELHWRVADFRERDWKKNPRAGQAGKYIETVESFIKQEIDKRLKDKTYSESCKEDMLSEWIEQLVENKLSHDQVLNLCMTYLTMGHENVATSIAWTLILLAENTKTQDDCRAEALTKKPTATDLASMKRLTDAYHETTRLYPSVPSLTRMALVDTELAGYKIPKGTEVITNTYLIHRDEKIFGDDARNFNPSRYDASVCPVAAKISTEGPPDAFPFGVGERSCLGRFLGYLEVRCIVGEILRNFKLTIVEPKDESVSPHNFVSLRPGPHKMKFECISNNSSRSSKL